MKRGYLKWVIWGYPNESLPVGTHPSNPRRCTLRSTIHLVFLDYGAGKIKN